jgi:hypothetical protein
MPPRPRRHRNGHTPHDRRGLYRLPSHAKIAAVEIDDPYAHGEAKLDPAEHANGSTAHGAPEWRVVQPRLVVIRSLRGDQIARMNARHQIDDAQFAAGRFYQNLNEQAFASALSSADPERPVIDGGRHYEPFNDRQRVAIRRLRVINGTVALRLGVDTLVLVHAVLLTGRSVASAARDQPGAADINYWRAAFRLALDEIAALAGLATKQPVRPALPEKCALQAAVMLATVQNAQKVAAK